MSVLSDVVWIAMVLRGVVTYGVAWLVCNVGVCVGDVVCLDLGLVMGSGIVVGLGEL